jgi:hypothetical protein
MLLLLLLLLLSLLQATAEAGQCRLLMLLLHFLIPK